KQLDKRVQELEKKQSKPQPAPNNVADLFSFDRFDRQCADRRKKYLIRTAGAFKKISNKKA
ncbi:MAG: hypothetical protein ABIH67_01205, partial [Candidatus Uhrbacteria bacterium]